MFASDPSSRSDDNHASADVVVARLLVDGPSASAAAVLDAIDVRQLSRRGTVDYVKAWDQLTAWTTARPMSALVSLAGSCDPRVDGDNGDELMQTSVFEELRLSLNVSQLAIDSRVEVARDLESRFTDTQQSLLSGKISYPHARALVEGLAQVRDAETAIEIEQRALAKSDRSVGRFRRFLREAVDTVDPAATLARHKKAAAERTIKRWELPDGMGCLQVEAAAPDIATMWSALTLLSGPKESDDPRPLGARRVDAMLGLCLGAVAPDPETDAHRPGRVIARPKAPIEAQVVIDLPTLIGLADNPAELRGFGKIPAGLARDWLQQPNTWRRLVTDPVDGHLLDYGPVVRSAPPKLHAYVVNRHTTCCFPGCNQPSKKADLDHEPPWQADGKGGRTSAEGLRPLCRRHHRLRTFLGWKIDHLRDGGVRWTSPSGQIWNIPPPPVLGPD
ncbi:MAG TPA: DUF222 domain-containing protein [Actinomycetes bacterium]|nr:DUF222 domain-containing protein [Actinomycetes bacterium]